VQDLWRTGLLTMDTARNRLLVILDWAKARMFGRDVSRE